MKVINTEEFNELIKNGTVVIDFFADWCGPCKMLSPVIEEVSGEYTDIEFAKVNVDDNMDLAEKFGIMSIPQVYMFRNGEVVNKFGGYRDIGGVRAFIDQNK
ncbi:MAG: thioredoxin [Erysipelotrichaceae bacterium]|nr:thioredoxin [Erysipelotrichaceae bacterium]MBR6233628.1 thioredoxin [Erysipelotrichaceae bacterium]